MPQLFKLYDGLEVACLSKAGICTVANNYHYIP